MTGDSPSAILEKLDEQMGHAQRALEIQFSRIAQMQHEIDQLRTRLNGKPKPADR